VEFIADNYEHNQWVPGVHNSHVFVVFFIPIVCYVIKKSHFLNSTPIFTMLLPKPISHDSKFLSSTAMVLWRLKYDSMFVEEATKEGTRAPDQCT